MTKIHWTMIIIAVVAIIGTYGIFAALWFIPFPWNFAFVMSALAAGVGCAMVLAHEEDKKKKEAKKKRKESENK